MLTMMFNGLNLCNPLDEQMDALIETFVSVHGEKKRKVITERLNNTTFIFVPRMFDDAGGLREAFTERKKEISREFFETLGTPALIGTIEIDEIYRLKASLEKDIGNPLTAFALDQLCKKLGIFEEVQDYRDKMNGGVRKKKRYTRNDALNGFIASEETKQKLFNFFNRAIELDGKIGANQRIKELTIEYENISRKLSEISLVDSKIKREQIEATDSLLLEYMPKLFHRSKENFMQCYDEEQRNKLLWAYKMLLNRGRENFADEMTLTGSAKYDCLTLFQEMGYYLGSDLSEYAEIERLMNLLFNESVIEEYRLIESSYENERARRNPFFVDGVKTIEGLDIQGGNLFYINQLYKYMLHNGTISAEVMHYLNSEGEVRCICLLPLSVDLNRTTLLHECEHIIETTILGMVVKCGIESYGVEIDDEDYDGFNLPTSDNDDMCGGRETREWEDLNETMVQMFAYMLLANSEEFGLTIGDPKAETSWHAKMVRLFDGFVDYAEELSNVRLNNNPRAFQDVFGPSNALVMNEVAKTYHELLRGRQGTYIAFLERVNENTGLQLEEVDFLNLKDDLYWSPSDREFLTQHILLAKVLENLKTSMGQKEESSEADPNQLN